MRLRMMTALSVLVLVVLGALMVPLAVSYSSAQARTLYLDREADADHFASLASMVTTDAQTLPLTEELREYDALYGIQVAVVDTTGAVRTASSPGMPVMPGDDPVRTALSGRSSAPPERMWPEQDPRPLVVAVPVTRNGDVIGAVVTVSQTSPTRTAVGVYCAGLVLVVCAALVAGLWLAHRTTRWILRPVQDLDHAATEVATGRYRQRVDASTGPPELRRLAGTFNEMVTEVEHAIERQRAFVADASHQLRNPLQALLLRLGDLGMRVPARMRDDVDEAAADARYLNRTLDSLLDLAKAEHRAGPVEILDVETAIRGRLDAWAPAAAAKAATVDFCSSGGARVLARPADLTGAFDVLIDNAIKFSPHGGRVSVQVSVRVATSGNNRGRPKETARVRISVADHGPGVDADELSRLGDRFWRSRQHQNVPGSGLGLAIARELVQQHGGHLLAEPNHPRGLVVHLDLPASHSRHLPPSSPAAAAGSDPDAAVAGQGF